MILDIKSRSRSNIPSPPPPNIGTEFSIFKSPLNEFKLFESLDKMIKSSKHLLRSQVSKSSEVADCLFNTFVCQIYSYSYMFSCPDVKIAFGFTVLNSTEAITLKIIKKILEQKLLGSTSLRQKWLTVLGEDLKMVFDLLYDIVLSTEFSRRSLIFNDFLPTNGKNKQFLF